MGNTEFHVENQPLEEQADWRTALAIQRRGEIIEFTRWTITELKEQPSNELDEVLLYGRKKAAALRERDALNNAKGKRGTNR